MRAIGIIVGFLVALFGLPFLLIGLGIVGYVGDLSRFDVPLRGFEPPPRAAAVVSPEIGGDTADLPAQVREASVSVRIAPGPGSGPLFIGLAPASALRPYLRRAPVAAIRVRDGSTGAATDAQPVADGPPDPQVLIQDQELQVDLQLVNPRARAKRLPPPGRQDFWTRAIETDGSEPFTVTVNDLQGEGGRIVIMRADGRAGITATADLRFRLPILKTIGWWVLGVSLLVVGGGLALAIGLIARGGRRGGPTAPPPAAAGADGAPRPAVDTAPLDAGDAADTA